MPTYKRSHVLSVKTLLIASLGLLGFLFGGLLNPLSQQPALVSVAFASDTPVDVWWPSSGATLSGTQPFKAIVKNRSLSEYSMYWQVDGGTLVKMDDSQQDYPHKEAVVDLSGWNWNPTGSYKLTFVAKDHGGNEISRNIVDIKIPTTAASSVAPVPAPTPAPAPAPVTQIQSVQQPIQQAAQSAPSVVSSAPAPAVTTGEIENWWPTANAHVTGNQPFKAVLKNQAIESYKMYWSIDGGNQIEMYNSYADAPHKENYIDFTSWKWKGNDAYNIKLTAKDFNGKVITEKTIPVYTNTSSPNLAAAVTNTITQSVEQTVTQVQSALSGGLYVNPYSVATRQYNDWKSHRSGDAEIMRKIGAESTGSWLGGWNQDVKSDVQKIVSAASSQGTVPTLVVYNIPGRDCGHYSAGGLGSKDAYLSWIRQVSDGIGDRKAIVILEPDAIAGIECLSDSAKNERYAMLSSAVDTFKSNGNTRVYLDAGHARWIEAGQMAARLAKAGVAKSAGFFLNVSNFIGTEESINYGEKVSASANGAHFVIDTSRNGKGSNGEWCNPWGRALGQKPTLNTGRNLVDAYLWIKQPGESDGTCNGGPSAGQWWPDYALDLGRNAGY